MDIGNSFGLLDLPKDIRLIVYKRLPRCIRHQSIYLHPLCYKGGFHTQLTLVLRSIPMAILAVSQPVYHEALAVVHTITADVILRRSLKLIYEGQVDFNECFFRWVLDAISMEAQRRQDARMAFGMPRRTYCKLNRSESLCH
jgi:hypothetical protein